MKKGLALITLSCAGLIGTGATVACISTPAPIVVHAEEEPPVVTNTVVITEVDGGSIVADKLTGEVGEIVTLTPKAKLFYKLESITVNEVALIPSEEGTYSFALVAGENVVKATFVVDEAIAKEFATIWESIQSKDWKNVFTVQNLMLFINYILNSGLGVSLVVLFRKYRNTKTIDREDVIKALTEAIPEQTDALIEKIFGEKFVPMLTEALTKMTDIQEAVTVLARCMALAQENTPESRMAIVELLSQIKLGDKNVADEVLKVIQEELAKINAKVEENKALLAELREKNEEAKVESEKELIDETTPVDNGTQI